MTRRLGKLTAPAALLLAAGLTLSACGDKGDNTADGSTSSAAASTSAAPRAAAATALTSDTFASVMTTAQTKARTSHVSMDIGIGGQSIKAEGDLAIGSSAADTAMALTMDMGAAGAGSLQMRLVDQAFYLDFGPVTDNKFAKIDLRDTSNPIGKQYSQLVDQIDPSKQLDQFKNALKTFVKKGDAVTVDGVKAQPYLVVVDTKKIASLADLPGAAAASVPPTIEYTMYIGPDNLPRRIVTDVSGSKIEIDYSKWGEPVDVKAPPASEVTDKDLSSLLGGATAPSA